MQASPLAHRCSLSLEWPLLWDARSLRARVRERMFVIRNQETKGAELALLPRISGPAARAATAVLVDCSRRRRLPRPSLSFSMLHQQREPR